MKESAEGRRPFDAVRVLILLCGWLLALLYAYPGMMSTDSVVQLLQARGNEPIGDWHPPVMAALWRCIDALIAGPFGMLLLQMCSFMLGLDAILRQVVRPRAAAVVTVVLILLPPVIAPMAVIWKDSQMAGYLLAGTALLLASKRAPRLAGYSLLTLATAMRYNAVAATLPIIFLLSAPRYAGWKRYSVASVAWLVVTVAGLGSNAALREKREHAWHSSVAIMDIVGTIRYSPRWHSDKELENLLADTPLVVHTDILKWCRWWYTPFAHWPMSHGERRIFDPPQTQSERDAIERTWKTVVTSDPLAYLKHRANVFEYVVTDNPNELMAPVWDGYVELPSQAQMVEVGTRHSMVQRAWIAANASVARTFLFCPRFYLILCVCFLLLARTRLSLMILSSGLMYEASLFFAAPSADYRYSHWMITATLIGSVLVFLSRYARQTAANAGVGGS